MGILERVEKLLQGKKTYIIMALIAIGAVLKARGVEIPDFIWPILAALGMGAVRSAVSKIEKTG